MAVRLAYQKYSANGSLLAPLVILHGVFGSKLNWRSMSKKLVNILERDVCIVYSGPLIQYYIQCVVRYLL